MLAQYGDRTHMSVALSIGSLEATGGLLNALLDPESLVACDTVDNTNVPDLVTCKKVD